MKRESLFILIGCVVVMAICGSGQFPRCRTTITLVLSATWALTALRENRKTATPGADKKAPLIPRFDRARLRAAAGRLRTLSPGSVSGLVGRVRGAGTTPSLHLAFALLLLFMLLTALPVPLCLSKLALQPRAAQNEAVSVALRDARDLGIDAPGGARFALTRNRAGTLKLILLAVAVFCGGLLAARLEEPHREHCRVALVLMGGAMAVAGLVSLYVAPQGDTLWWLFRTRRVLPGPLGGFINRNHFAGFLAMLAPLAVTLSATAFASRRILKASLAAAAGTLMALTAVLSLSRGATLACAAGLLITAVLLLRKRRLHALLTLGAIVVLTLVALHYLPMEQVRDRLDTLRDPLHTQSGQTRINAWCDSARIWATYPVIGAGPDAFRFVYPQHRRTSAHEFMTHPENEYVQLAADTGLAGLALAALLLLALVRFVRAGRPPGTSIDVATAGAMAVIAVHACFDFALHVPLYAVVAGVLLGLARPPGGHRTHASPERVRRLAVGLPLLAGVMLVVDLCVGLHAMDSRSRMEKAEPRRLAHMLAWSPTAWQAWYHLGRHACLTGKPEAARFGESCIARAATLDPNNYLLWLELGRLRLSLRDHAGARSAFARVRELRDWVQLPKVPED